MEPGRCGSCGRRYQQESDNNDEYHGIAGRDEKTDPGLELRDFFIREGIGFGNDGDQVNLCVKLTHELHVNGLQAATELSGGDTVSINGSDIRMAGWLNEVKTGMNTVVNNFLPVYAVLLLQVGVEAALNVLNNGFPAVRKI